MVEEVGKFGALGDLVVEADVLMVLVIEVVGFSGNAGECQEPWGELFFASIAVILTSAFGDVEGALLRVGCLE